MRRRNKLVAAFAAGVALVASLFVATQPAQAAQGQQIISIPATVPCYVKADGTVITPTNWKIENKGTTEVGIKLYSYGMYGAGDMTLSVRCGVNDEAKHDFVSYNGVHHSDETTFNSGDVLEPGDSLNFDWSIGQLDGKQNDNILNEALNGGAKPFNFQWQFGAPKECAVTFEDGTARLYRRYFGSLGPVAGKTFWDYTDSKGGYGGKVKSVTFISPHESLFAGDTSLTSVKVVDKGIKPETMKNWFSGCTNLKEVDLTKLDTSQCKDMWGTFQGCSSLGSVDVSGFDTSSVTEMGYMFSGCSSLEGPDVSGWNIGNVTTIWGMFNDCKLLDGLDVSQWDTSKVQGMGYVFAGCSSLSSLDVSSWNTSSATSMWGLFRACSKLDGLDVSRWNTSSVASMGELFRECGSLTSLDVSNWDTSKVESMYAMFYSCGKLETLGEGNVSKWDTSRNTSLDFTFSSCSALKDLDISRWNTSSTVYMSYTFAYSPLLHDLDVSNWDTSSSASVAHMFAGCSSITSLDFSNWNIGVNVGVEYIISASGVRSFSIGEGWKANLNKVNGYDDSDTRYLWDENGNMTFDSDTPVGVHATYYTRKEYVPKKASEESANAEANEGASTGSAETGIVADAPTSNDVTSDASPSDGSAEQEEGGVDSADVPLTGEALSQTA